MAALQEIADKNELQEINEYYEVKPVKKKQER